MAGRLGLRSKQDSKDQQWLGAGRTKGKTEGARKTGERSGGMHQRE